MSATASQASLGAHHEMSRLQSNVNLASVLIPIPIFVATVLLGWVSWDDLLIFGIMYVPTGLGITVGFHRYFTHRAFKTYPWVRYTLAILGQGAIQGALIDWLADHRKHHSYTDVLGDPHSPWLSANWLRGLLHAHVGWLMNEQGRADWDRYAGDLVKDPVIRKISNLFPLIALLSLIVVPAGLGYLIEGGLTGVLYGVIWGGFIRMFVLNHITWSINSICHMFGKRRFDTDDESRNVWWLALVSLGEAWHNNHHAFQQSAKQGQRWWELDPSAAVIWLLEWFGLAWDVVRATPEQQQRKLAAQR